MMLIIFETIAVVLWRTKDNLFYLFNFSYIGISISLGIFLFTQKYKYARRVTQLLVGCYMLIYLGLICGENMQIEGFWYYLFTGVFEAATIHYAVAKIFGPLLFGRGWCGYACWTAMVLDFLGLAKLFGTSTLNGTWWYMSAAIIFIICVPLFMIKEEYLVFILVAVAAFPRTISMEVMGITGIYAFLPVFLMGMCVAKYDLFNRWFKIWNAGMKHVFKFLLELLAVFILYKAYRTLPLTVYSEIHWGVYPIVFMAFCCEFINVIPGVRQILLFLGKHSMNIFLTHTFLRQYSFVYVSGYFLTNTLTLLLASLAVSIALEWLKKVSGYNRLIQNICVKAEQIM